MTDARPDNVLIDAIVDSLRAAADPSRAPAMQAYMRSDWPHLGVPVPLVRRITKDLERTRPPASTEQLIATAGELWRAARFREHRYAANQLTDTARARRLRTMAMLALFTEFITTGAWWDHVDETSHRIGDLLLRHPDEMRPVIRRWASQEDRWLRRTSDICQIGLRSKTDLDLLRETIDANVADSDFFLRKAIGWALREYGKTDPDWVRGFVAERDAVLSGLSKREALKHLQIPQPDSLRP